MSAIQSDSRGCSGPQRGRGRIPPGSRPTSPARRLAVPALAMSVVLAATGPPAVAQEPDRWEEARRRMVRDHIRSPGGLSQPVTDEHVLRAMRTVPRHEFVPERYRSLAYRDRPLPIGHGQTISQPYIVAWMTALLELGPGEKVLEVGTGSGYQAAVLAEITDSVFSIEIIGDLARSARRRLRRLGYDEVRVRHGDGWRGWPEHAPFDAIVVTAAPEEIPPPLIEQLADGGRMVLPRGPAGGTQVLTLVRKEADGSVTTRELSFVRFVPFQRRTEPAGADTSGGPAAPSGGEVDRGRGASDRAGGEADGAAGG